MSITSALHQQNSSIDELAKLPQAMIMQMAQKKEIAPEMVAPILSRKAEMMEAGVPPGVTTSCVKPLKGTKANANIVKNARG